MAIVQELYRPIDADVENQLSKLQTDRPNPAIMYVSMIRSITILLNIDYNRLSVTKHR